MELTRRIWRTVEIPLDALMIVWCERTDQPGLALFWCAAMVIDLVRMWQRRM